MILSLPILPMWREKEKKDVQKSVLESEPKNAVFAGKNGLLYIKKFLAKARNFLTKEGKFIWSLTHGRKRK